jgi:hypothetical protein
VPSRKQGSFSLQDCPSRLTPVGLEWELHGLSYWLWSLLYRALNLIADSRDAAW